MFAKSPTLYESCTLHYVWASAGVVWRWPCGASSTYVYQYAEVGRVQTEMVRPSVKGTVGGKPFGGFTYEKLRIAAIARCIQTRLALHSCTTRYCLAERSSCRASVLLAHTFSDDTSASAHRLDGPTNDA